jgi:hypothetical protein
MVVTVVMFMVMVMRNDLPSSEVMASLGSQLQTEQCAKE